MKVIKEAISNIDAEGKEVVISPTMADALDFSERKEKEAAKVIEERTPELEEQPKVEMAKLNLDEELNDAELNEEFFIDSPEAELLDKCFAYLRDLKGDKDFIDFAKKYLGMDNDDIAYYCGEDIFDGKEVEEGCENCEEAEAIDEDISEVSGSVGDVIKNEVFPKIDDLKSTGELLEVAKQAFMNVDPKFKDYADEVLRNLAKKPFPKACIYLGDIMLKGEGLGSPDMKVKEEVCNECDAQPIEECDKVLPVVEDVDSRPRAYTDDLLAAIEDGFVDEHTALLAALKYMSDDDVGEMCYRNDFNIGTDMVEEATNLDHDTTVNDNVDDLSPEEEGGRVVVEEDAKSAWDKVAPLLQEDANTDVVEFTTKLAGPDKGKSEAEYEQELRDNLPLDIDFEIKSFFMPDVVVTFKGPKQKLINALCNNEYFGFDPADIEDELNEELNEAKGEDITLFDRVYIDLDKQSGDDAKFRKFGKEFNNRRYNGPDEIFTARDDDGITVAADDLSFAQEVADAYDLDTKDTELDVKRVDEEGNEKFITIPALTILIPNEEEFVEDLEGLQGLAEAYSRYFH